MTTLREKRFWESLLQVVEDGRAVPIVGQGLLRVDIDGRETPLYQYLAARLADYLDVELDDLPEEAPLNAVACRHLERRDTDPEDIYAGLKTILSGEKMGPAKTMIMNKA